MTIDHMWPITATMTLITATVLVWGLLWLYRTMGHVRCLRLRSGPTWATMIRYPNGRGTLYWEINGRRIQASIRTDIPGACDKIIADALAVMLCDDSTVHLFDEVHEVT
jgi:hypothetical protein